MRALTALPRTLVTLLSGFVATVVCGSLVIVLGRIPRARTLTEKVIRAWSAAWLVPAGCELEVVGREKVDTTRSYVVVANHLSNLDVMVCFQAIPLPIRYLAKKELFSIPLLATAMRSIGIVEVDRQARSAAIESVNQQSSRVIQHGDSLIIYPEGTRSRDGDLKPFKKGAFTMAVAAGMAVVPVTIHGTWEMWRPGGKTIRRGKVTVVIDDPLPTDGMQREDVEALRKQVREIIEGRFDALRSTASG